MGDELLPDDYTLVDLVYIFQLAPKVRLSNSTSVLLYYALRPTERILYVTD